VAQAVQAGPGGGQLVVGGREGAHAGFPSGVGLVTRGRNSAVPGEPLRA
jgi:hypothetical protein